MPSATVETHNLRPGARWAAPLWLLLARWLARRGLAAVARSALRQAAEGGNAEAGYQLGKQLLDAGNGRDALPVLEAAQARQPRDTRLLLALGAALRYQGRLSEARQAFEQVLVLEPGYPQALNNLGELELVSGKPELALSHFDLGLRQAPDLMPLHVNKVAALLELARYDEALSQSEQVLERFPLVSEVHVNHGNILLQSGKARPAVKAFQQALALDPGCAEAHFNLATLFGEASHLQETVEYLESEIRLKGETVQRLGSLAVAQAARKDYGAAVLTCEKVLAMQPANLSALLTLAGARGVEGDHRGSIEYYRKALAINPAMSAIQSNIAFESTYLEDATTEEIFALHREWATHHELPRHDRQYDHVLPVLIPERLRIAYVSGDFGTHPVGFLLRDVIAQHDRNTFEVHCFSMMRREDDITVSIRESTEHWHDILLDSDEEVAQRIHEAGIHILVDLSGHTAYNRLPAFALRPAPIAATWIGYFHSTGLSSIDYYITDPHTSPRGSAQIYSEKPLWLPYSRFCYSPPAYAGEVAPAPVAERGYVTFGCFNRLDKLSAPVIAAWSRVLAAVPPARLLIKAGGLGDEQARRQVEARFAACGITAERLELRGPSSHVEMLQEYGDVDIALDPFPFNGGMTTLEALWMGVPVVTLAGQGIVSRQTHAVLANMELTERLSFGTLDDYVTGAIALAQDSVMLAELRREIRPRLAQSPVCQPERFARDLETLYRRMWEAYRNGTTLPGDL